MTRHEAKPQHVSRNLKEMAFSKRQNIFVEYLLKKLGFNDSQLINDYLNKLESIYGKYYKEWRQQTNKSGYVRDFWVLRYSNSECIEQLLKEIEIKKNLGLIKLENINFESKISATDLSSFDFCPASYSIAKSFQIEYPTNEDKRSIGKNLHESLRLLKKVSPEKYTESKFLGYDVSENEKIKKIKKCELLFSGHTNEKKFFVNEELDYIGQPDYIFKDPNGKLFVVEEKFKYLNNYADPNDYKYDEILKERNRIKNTFHSNHIVQLQSYIDCIKDYDLEYGILIYWFYDFNNEYPNVHSVSLKVIKKNENQEILFNTFLNIKKFLKKQVVEFNDKINPNKCAACSVNKYCAHKTNNLKELKIPYDRYDLKLKYMKFPEELKKD